MTDDGYRGSASGVGRDSAGYRGAGRTSPALSPPEEFGAEDTLVSGPWDIVVNGIPFRVESINIVTPEPGAVAFVLTFSQETIPPEIEVRDGDLNSAFRTPSTTASSFAVTTTTSNFQSSPIEVYVGGEFVTDVTNAYQNETGDTLGGSSPTDKTTREDLTLVCDTPPTEVKPLEVIGFSVKVTNNGPTDGVVDVGWFINGSKEFTRVSVDVPAGETTPIDSTTEVAEDLVSRVGDNKWDVEAELTLVSS